MMKQLISFLLLALLGVASAAGIDQPNFIYILSDELAYFDPGFMGNQEIQTPNLDRMAAEGNVLRQFYVANTACTPSRTALLTGTYAHRIGMDGNVLFPGEKRGLNPNVWFGNVEQIASERIGRETVTYVSNIYKYYVAYKLLSEERDRRVASKAAMKPGIK